MPGWVSWPRTEGRMGRTRLVQSLGGVEEGGEGGLNKAFFGLGYQITEGLSIGVDAHYNFGNIQNKTIYFSLKLTLTY